MAGGPDDDVFGYSHQATRTDASGVGERRSNAAWGSCRNFRRLDSSKVQADFRGPRAAATSFRIACAAARGFVAAVIGRPTTRKLAPALVASPGVATRAWSFAADPAGRTLGTRIRKSSPQARRIARTS